MYVRMNVCVILSNQTYLPPSGLQLSSSSNHPITLPRAGYSCEQAMSGYLGLAKTRNPAPLSLSFPGKSPAVSSCDMQVYTEHTHSNTGTCGRGAVGPCGRPRT